MVTLLGSRDARVQRSAVRALQLLYADNQGIKLKVASAGAFPHLVMLLGSNNVQIQVDTLMAICFLCEDNVFNQVKR